MVELVFGWIVLQIGVLSQNQSGRRRLPVVRSIPVSSLSLMIPLVLVDDTKVTDVRLLLVIRHRRACHSNILPVDEDHQEILLSRRRVVELVELGPQADQAVGPALAQLVLEPLVYLMESISGS